MFWQEQVEQEVEQKKTQQDMQRDEAQTSESQVPSLPQKSFFSYFSGFKETIQQSISTAQKTVTQQFESIDLQVSSYIEKVIQPEAENQSPELNQEQQPKVNFNSSTYSIANAEDQNKLQISSKFSKSNPEISQSVKDSDTQIQKDQKYLEEQQQANKLAKQQYLQTQQCQDSNKKLVSQLQILNKSQLIQKFLALKNEYVWNKKLLKEAQQQLELQSETNEVQQRQLGLLKAQIQKNDHLEESESQMYNQIQTLISEKNSLENQNFDLQRNYQILQEMVNHMDQGEDASASTLHNSDNTQNVSRNIDRNLSIDDLSLQVLEYLQDLDIQNQRSHSTSLQNFRKSLDRLQNFRSSLDRINRAQTTPNQLLPQHSYEQAMGSQLYSSGKKQNRNLLQSFEEDKENQFDDYAEEKDFADQPLQEQQSQGYLNEDDRQELESYNSLQFQDAFQTEETLAQIQKVIKNSVDRSTSKDYRY